MPYSWTLNIILIVLWVLYNRLTVCRWESNANHHSFFLIFYVVRALWKRINYRLYMLSFFIILWWVFLWAVTVAVPTPYLTCFLSQLVFTHELISSFWFLKFLIYLINLLNLSKMLVYRVYLYIFTLGSGTHWLNHLLLLWIVIENVTIVIYVFFFIACFITFGLFNAFFFSWIWVRSYIIFQNRLHTSALR